MVIALVRLGYVRLVAQWEPGTPQFPAPIEGQTLLLDTVFPRREDLLESDDGEAWFDTAECPIGVEWHWPGRKPEPLFPGHNPRFNYVDEDWNGRIHPEWSNWRFTSGPKELDDFETLKAAREFWAANPDYYLQTSPVEILP